jgi:hypothetical protein
LLKAWLAHFVAKHLPSVADIVEMTDRLAPSEVQTADADFARNNLPTLSAIRLRFWKPIRLATKRGHIRGEVEYYAVRNAAEMTEDDEVRAALWS